MQGNSEARVGRAAPLLSSPSPMYADEQAGPSNLSMSRHLSAVSRSPSEGLWRMGQRGESSNAGCYPPSPRPLPRSTSPPQTPPVQSPDSPMASHSPPLRRSPAVRSTPSSSNRRRYSEQSFSTSHHSPGPNFGSFVGSYEESLLSGRMSSLPSKPLTFDAELGVLGLGKCKSSLRCPPHVNFTFPAHFYSLEGAAEKEGKVSPGTPYVGTIDVEGHYLDMLFTDQMGALHLLPKPAAYSVGLSPPPPTPSFPGYRIPPKGQIQLVIKNPNLTAVKLFLVPYDLSDMPAGTKTFIRQKSHVVSPGPGNDASSAAASVKGQTASSSTSPLRSQQHNHSRRSVGRETLRYAVHLQFCALPSSRSAKGRATEPAFSIGGLDRLNHPRKGEDGEAKGRPQIYLHKHIRVVFAARVPDSSEQLRVVTETPGGSEGSRDNIYSTYHGPSEEWKEARRAKRAREHAMVADAEREAVDAGEQEGESDVVTFHDDVINSDPNGERWFAETEACSLSGKESPGEGVDIPLTRRAPRLEHESQQHQQAEAPDTALTRSSAPVTATSFPAAAFDDGNRPPSRSLHVRQRTASPDEDRVDEDRALLEQWHATLALRPQQQSGRPLSPTNAFYPLTSRSVAPPSPARSAAPLSAMRHTMRPLTPQRTGEGLASPHAASFARVVPPGLDVVSGVTEQHTAHGVPKARRPSLMQRMSSQTQHAPAALSSSDLSSPPPAPPASHPHM